MRGVEELEDAGDIVPGFLIRRDAPEPADRTFACGEDLRARKGDSPYPAVDYPEIVRKIFSADRAICL